MLGRSRVRRPRAMQGKDDADADSNESYERMQLGANERASERVNVLFLVLGWSQPGGWRGHCARASSPSLARSIRPLASRFVADSISSQGQRNRCTNGRAQFDEWMEMARRRTIPPSLMVGIWCALVGQHACAVWYILCVTPAAPSVRLCVCTSSRSLSAMACVWQRDEWGASDARLSAVMDSWRLPSSSFPQVDRSIARCGCAFRQLCMQRPSHTKNNSKAS